MYSLIIAAIVLVACTPRTEDQPVADQPQPEASTPAPAPAPATEPAAATQASAEGTVEEVDPAASTVTIAHGAVEALKWPAMTMTFKAPGVDLGGIKKGDHVGFEFTATGMDGTITSITKHE